MQRLILRFFFFGLVGSQLHLVLSAASAAESKSETVTLEAKPEPIAINPARTAVIVVDMENDFVTKGGMFDRAGADISGAQKAIAPTAKVLATARQAGIKIIYLKMGYHADLSDLGAPDSVNRTRHLKFGVGQTIRAPDGRESRVLIRDTWGTDIVPELKPQASDIVIYKTRFSGFYQTDLDATLKKFGIKYLNRPRFAENQPRSLTFEHRSIAWLGFGLGAVRQSPVGEDGASQSMNRSFESRRAPEPVGAFPHAKRVGNLLFLSGIGPRVRGSKEIPGVMLSGVSKRAARFGRCRRELE